ncbi:hypothetical protein V8D89_007188 [Ganoderma adspersum]
MTRSSNSLSMSVWPSLLGLMGLSGQTDMALGMEAGVAEGVAADVAEDEAYGVELDVEDITTGLATAWEDLCSIGSPHVGKLKGKWQYRKRGNRQADQDDEQPLAEKEPEPEPEPEAAPQDGMDVDREPALAEETFDDNEDNGPVIGEDDYDLLL